jgi:hypothetical protein
MRELLSSSPVDGFRITCDRARSAASDAEAVERDEHSVAQLRLSDWAEPAMAVNPLVQLAGSTGSATTVRESEVVEHEQLPRSQVDLDLDVLYTEAVLFEERDLGAQAVELGATEKIRIGLHARKSR